MPDSVLNSPRNYSNDATRALDRLLAAADSKAKAVEDIIARRTQARADLLAAESRYLDTLADEDLKRFADAKGALAHLELAASSLLDAGGADGIRHRFIHTAETFALLASGFADRIERLGEEMPKAMKALADIRHAKTLAGIHTALIERDEEVQRLRLVGEMVVADRNNSVALRDWCLRWTPASKDQNQSFNSLYGSLQAPLPI